MSTCNQLPAINLAELSSATDALQKAFACLSCHKIDDEKLKLQPCCGRAYCEDCISELSYCICCGHPLIIDSLSMDVLLRVNGFRSKRQSEETHGTTSPNRILESLKELVNSDSLRLFDRTSGGQIYFGGDMTLQPHSYGRIGRLKFERARTSEEKRGLGADKKLLDFNVAVCSNESITSKRISIKLESEQLMESQNPSAKETTLIEDNKDEEQKMIMEKRKAHTFRSRKRRKKSPRSSQTKKIYDADMLDKNTDEWTLGQVK
mmetsp:Transcript_4784/g.7388  ORF Transcript_4784/g.7388 Transcript_4784/m.7388 type:complete len:263 (+) Transcript_4784:222-1010(+)